MKAWLTQRRQGAKENQERQEVSSVVHSLDRIVGIRMGSYLVENAVHENEIATIVVDACSRIHTQVGPGLLESVYQRLLAYERQRRELAVQSEVPIRLRYDNIEFDEAFRADIVVENKVILELKSVEAISPVHKKSNC